MAKKTAKKDETKKLSPTMFLSVQDVGEDSWIQAEDNAQDHAGETGEQITVGSYKLVEWLQVTSVAEIVVKPKPTK